MNWPIVRKFANVFLPRRMKKLPAEEVFNKIYQDGIWGKDHEGNATSGSGSHAGDIVKPYIEAVSKFLVGIDPAVVVDLGCGDFNVGKQLAPFSKKYIACDVSSHILERNRQKFSIDNVEFRKINIIDDELPNGDVCCIRQVLQHLSNDDIVKFVKKLNERAVYNFLLVTEHVPDEPDFEANLDQRKGAGIRMNRNSGVDLSKPPFNLRYQAKETIVSVKASIVGEKGHVLTTLYTLAN